MQDRLDLCDSLRSLTENGEILQPLDWRIYPNLKQWSQEPKARRTWTSSKEEKPSQHFWYDVAMGCYAQTHIKATILRSFYRTKTIIHYMLWRSTYQRIVVATKQWAAFWNELPASCDTRIRLFLPAKLFLWEEILVFVFEQWCCDRSKRSLSGPSSMLQLCTVEQ